MRGTVPGAVPDPGVVLTPMLVERFPVILYFMLNEGIDAGPDGCETGADGFGNSTEEVDGELGGLRGGPQSKLTR